MECCYKMQFLSPNCKDHSLSGIHKNLLITLLNYNMVFGYNMVLKMDPKNVHIL